MSIDGMERRMRKAYEVLSGFAREGYRDPLLISNQVLGKNPFNNKFFQRFCEERRVPGPSGFTIVSRMILYYAKSLIHYVFYLIKFIEHAFSGYRFRVSPENDELILIDVSFVTERIISSKRFRDIFLPGLEEALKKMGKHYAYLPFFYSTAHGKRPGELYNAEIVLKKEKVPALTEFQVLSVKDLAKILRFIFVYPFHVLKFAASIDHAAEGAPLLKDELVETLDQITFYSYARYLQGRQIARLPYKRIKVISWYENQPLHKNLYKGLREGGRSKPQIYGAQLFVYSKNSFYIVPDEMERPFGVVPDKILVSSRYYIPESSRLNYVIGPSFRSAQIYDIDTRREGRKKILVLLPYFEREFTNILKMVSGSGICADDIIVKSHPATPLIRYRALIPTGARIADGSVYKLFEQARIVISSGSNVLAEATSLGIPAISVRNSAGFDYANPLPEHGKGILWEEASSPEEIHRAMRKFEELLECRPQEVEAMACEYKNMFFCRSTEEGIKKAFDL